MPERSSTGQRGIWESRCPSLLDDRDRLFACLDELLEVASRMRAGDSSLDPETWYAIRDASQVALRKSAALERAEIEAAR